MAVVATSRGRAREGGFTLIELIIVMAIISVLAAIAVPRYIQSVKHAKEAVLREDLHVMRNAIDSYTVDKEKARRRWMSWCRRGI